MRIHFSLVFVSLLHASVYQTSLQAVNLNPRALAEASAQGDMKLIRELLSKGADANYPDKSGHYPLDHAIRNGNRKLTMLLLANGANPNRIDSSGLSPAMNAIIMARADILSLLLSSGADPNLVSNASLSEPSGPQPISALTLAVNRRQYSMARALIEHGANPLLSIPPATTNSSSVHTVIFSPAIEQPSFAYTIDAIMWRALGQLIYNTDSPDWSADNDKWLLHHAARTNNLNMLKKGLYQAGLSPDTPSSQGVTPLMVASRYANFRIAEFLLSSGANSQIRDNQGRTALAYAAYGGSLELISRLASITQRKKSPSLIASPYLYALLNADSAVFHHLHNAGLNMGLDDLSVTRGITLPMAAAWLGDELAIALMLSGIGTQSDKTGRNTLAWALAAFRLEREVAQELKQQSRVEGLYSLIRKLASVRPLRQNTNRLIIEAWSEQASWESGLGQWRQLKPPPVPLAGEKGNYTVHKIIRDEEAIE